MNAEVDESCGTCHWARLNIPPKGGAPTEINPRQKVCKRNPPVPFPVPDPSGRGIATLTMRPMVDISDTCGEWEPEGLPEVYDGSTPLEPE